MSEQSPSATYDAGSEAEFLADTKEGRHAIFLAQHSRNAAIKWLRAVPRWEPELIAAMFGLATDTVRYILPRLDLMARHLTLSHDEHGDYARAGCTLCSEQVAA